MASLTTQVYMGSLTVVNCRLRCHLGVMPRHGYILAQCPIQMRAPRSAGSLDTATTGRSVHARHLPDERDRLVFYVQAVNRLTSGQPATFVEVTGFHAFVLAQCRRAQIHASAIDSGRQAISLLIELSDALPPAATATISTNLPTGHNPRHFGDLRFLCLPLLTGRPARAGKNVRTEPTFTVVHMVVQLVFNSHPSRSRLLKTAASSRAIYQSPSQHYTITHALPSIKALTRAGACTFIQTSATISFPHALMLPMCVPNPLWPSPSAQASGLGAWSLLGMNPRILGFDNWLYQA